jgi:hypothetical protein
MRTDTRSDDVDPHSIEIKHRFANRPRRSDRADLADPRFAGQIALPSSVKVGFAPPLMEIVLQAYGWEKGWALWSEMMVRAWISALLPGRCSAQSMTSFGAGRAIVVS